MTNPRWCLALLVGLAVLAGGMLGCKKTNDVPQNGPPVGQMPMGMPTRTPPLEETGPYAAGKKVYNANGCARCHTMGNAQAGPKMGAGGGPPMAGGGPPMAGGGPPMAGGGPPMAGGGPQVGGPMGGPPMGPKGPDLAKVAAKPERTVDWFIAYVSAPQKQNPQAKMPPFETKIKAEDMRGLAEFLASLK